MVLLQAVLHPVLELMGTPQNRAQLTRTFNEPLLVTGAVEATNFRRYMENLARQEESVTGSDHVRKRPAAAAKTQPKAKAKAGTSELQRLNRFYSFNRDLSDSDS